jgi:presenilin-like A22 family membrane protease
MSEEQFEATPLYVVPILATLLISVSCAFLIMQTGLELPMVTVLPETGYGPLLNALPFVLAAGFGATLIYFLLKRGVHLFLRLLMGTAFSALSFSLVVFYSELFFVAVDIEVPVAMILLVALFAAAIVVLEVFLRKGRFYGIIVLALGGAAGTLLGASIPVLSTVVILLALAVYDVVAVFRGPIGKIAATGLEHLPGASFSFRNVNVGLGDLTFYSMLVSRMFLSFGWVTCAAAILGVLLGAFFSFKMVERKGMFPGLPFSVMLGLLAGLTTILL